ncbi:hypothetical protein ANANG_G00132000 [Anguilla anguilla]|uniref:Coiled-coil domain-containing protein 39 n=1 Tax=Anguilla anguilla TaxID=7936 RepID=A0A9D3RYK3_ANGAN|nr:hypothetical protein ANANG_G00132000 [Anguilla anguilla]
MESRHCQHQEALSAKTQELQCLKSRENVLLANISAGQATIAGLQKQQSENEQVLVKKKELAHDQEVRMAAVERKVQALSEEEERMKERKTLQEEESDLAKTLREKKETAYRLRKQQKNTKMELRSGRRAVEKTADVHRDLSFQVEEMQLETDASVRELQRQSTEKQGALRKETALRRDVKRASGSAQSEADRLVAAETRRLQLELAVKELEVENAFKREMHLAKMVISRQGPKKLRAEVNQKLRRAETLRRKYETTAASSLRFQGGDRTPQPHMGRTCEDAGLQGRLELWTRRVSGKQEEVKVLKSTLHAHRSRNAEPRPSPGPTPTSGKDPGEQKLVEEKKALEETCSAKRRKILELQHDIKGQKTALDKLLREEAVQTRWVAEAGLWVQSLTEQLGSQEAKLDQAHQQSSELTLEAQSAWKTQEKTKEDEMEDIKLCELLDFSREVDLMLLAVMDEQTDLGSVLQAQFQQSDLSLPTPATPPATGRGQTPTCTSPQRGQQGQQ